MLLGLSYEPIDIRNIYYVIGFTEAICSTKGCVLINDLQIRR